jgi:hypothetical protein
MAGEEPFDRAGWSSLRQIQSARQVSLERKRSSPVRLSSSKGSVARLSVREEPFDRLRANGNFVFVRDIEHGEPFWPITLSESKGRLRANGDALLPSFGK